jgi:CoA:oxalate CoA-transferase
MLPLAGIRVVELASNIAGPFAGLVLADLGASVVKLERPGGGDVVRAWPPFGQGVSAAFAAMNRGKKSVAIDIKTEAGVGVARRLLANTDVFIVGMRPGKAGNSGLGWEDLRDTHPQLAYCEITGYGPTGPLAGEPGYDAILQAYSGLMDVTGYPDGPPARVGTGVIDFGTGMWAALGAVTVINRRAQTGRGGLVQPSLLGTSIGFLMHHIASITMAGVAPGRIGTAQHNAAPYEALRAADGLVMVGVTSPSLWSALCGALGCSELVTDPRYGTTEARVRNRDQLVTDLTERIGQRTAAETVDLLKAVGVPTSVIRPLSTLVDDEQVAAMEVLQATAAGQRLAVTPLPIDGDQADLSGATVPRLGEHTDEVLSELGWTPEELATLHEQGVVCGG